MPSKKPQSKTEKQSIQKIDIQKISDEQVIVESPGAPEQKEMVPLNLPMLARGYLQEYTAPEGDKIDRDALPEFMRNWKEVPADFPPVFKMLTKDDFISGIYTRLEEGVGPNKSNLYHMETGQGPQKIVCCLWGGTAMDRRMAKMKVGQRVAIVRGEAHPSDYGNPWINYHVFTPQ